MVQAAVDAGVPVLGEVELAASFLAGSRPSPSPAPTARAPPPRSSAGSSRPVACAPSSGGTSAGPSPRRRWPARSPGPWSSSSPASSWRPPRASTPRWRWSSTSPPTTSTATGTSPATPPPRRGSSPPRPPATTRWSTATTRGSARLAANGAATVHRFGVGEPAPGGCGMVGGALVLDRPGAADGALPGGRPVPPRAPQPRQRRRRGPRRPVPGPRPRRRSSRASTPSGACPTAWSRCAAGAASSG